jgi:hypothetical protein
MRIFGYGLLALISAVFAGSAANAQLLPGRNCAPVVPLDCPPGSIPLTPNADPNPNIPNPEGMAQQNALNNAFAQGSEGGGAAPRAFNDTFNGDFGGILVRRPVQVGTQRVQFGTLPSEFYDEPVYRDILVPLGTRYNGVLITDNDSPRPVDRAYFGYNYYNGIGAGNNSGFERVDLNRQTIGFEKTFLGGDASFGLRLPFIQTTGGPPDIAQSNIGDLSVLLKYAFINNLGTGDVASVGLVVTTPTGGGNNFLLPDGSTVPSSVLLQPWLGGVKMYERGYLQGITSLLVPTDKRDVTLFNNSAAVAWFLYQNATDRFINAVVPTLEAHVRTPLNHRSADDPIFFKDQVNLTASVNFRTVRASISPAICVPLASPQPYNAEFNVMLNLRY